MPTVRLLEALADKRVLGQLPAEIRGVAYDSRKVAPGEIFVAIPGLKQDGRRYVEDALARGATAVVLEGADLLEGRRVAACSWDPRGRRSPASPTRTSAIPPVR
jgi:UDP-N-acetylmuramyl tripeptide synthase